MTAFWQKNGGDAVPLPYSDTDSTGLPWDNLPENAEGRAACGYTEAPAQPAYDPTSFVCVWANGAWSVQARPTPPPVVVRVSHYEFTGLLTQAEQVKINVAKAEIRALTPANYQDSAYAGLVGLELVFNAFDLATEIELTNATTIYAVGTVMVQANILTADRAARVLANLPPA